jgi:diaminopimelate decarboxylase
MNFFTYTKGELHCEQVPVERVAREVGTPVFVYSKASFLRRYHEVAQAFKPANATICYSIKSCGNLNILRLLAREGCGFDVTSAGELYRAVEAGGNPKEIIFAGVGKTDDEIRAALTYGIAAFNLESEAEIENVDRVAGEMGLRTVGALRINPDVDPHTHTKTATGIKETKFGVDIERAERVFEQYRNLKNLRIGGVHIHIGSAVNEIPPYVDAVTKVTQLIDRLTSRGHRIEWFDVGGGFGVGYDDPDGAPSIDQHANALLPLLVGKPYKIALEPGRYIAGNSGVMLTRVLYRKQGGQKRFVIVDAGMNDLIRPTLYDAYHHIWPVKPDAANIPPDGKWSRAFAPRDAEVVDIVGPVCESGDYFAQSRPLPRTERGDVLAVFTAGAYGFAMSSNYNNRPRAAEVLVDGESYTVIRKRETLEDLVALERG